MSILGQWDEPGLPTAGSIKYNDIWGYADCEGNEYAIVGSARYIHFINITDPADPVEVSRFEGSVNSIWRDFKTYGHYAYAVADQGADGLMVFDLSQLPDTVLLAYQDNENFSRSHNVFIDETTGRLYLAGSSVAAYDLNEHPDEPIFLGTRSIPGGYFHDIYVRNHIAYCSHGGNGLWVYDFSNLDDIQVLGNLTSYPEQGYNHASWLNEEGTQLVFADETHGTSLKIADVSDLSDITILDLFRSELLAPAVTNSIAHNPFIRDHYAIVSYYHDGVQIFDLSDPEEVQRVAYYDTYPENEDYSGFQGNWGVYPFLPSGNIIATDITHGLFILSADSIDFEPLPLLEAVIEVRSGVVSSCAGDTTFLAASQTGMDLYEWSLNGEYLASGPELLATQPGSYQLIVSHRGCTKNSDLMELDFEALPEAELPESPWIYCGEAPPAIATSSQGDSYNWYFNGMPIIMEHGESLEITEGGLYQVEVINNNCSSLSDELEVILGQMPSPVLDFLLPDTYCAGSDVIEIDVSGSGNQYYTISETSSTVIDTFINGYIIATSGIYYIQAYTEYCSMEIEQPMEFSFSEPIIPTLIITDNTLTCSPAVSYQWYLDGALIPGVSEQHLIAEESGLYSVLTTDANGCTAQSETILLEITNGENIVEAKHLRVYPNPVGQFLYLEATASPEAVRVLSANGQEVTAWQQWKTGQNAMEVSTLIPGVYFFQFLYEHGVGSLRVVKH